MSKTCERVLRNRNIACSRTAIRIRWHRSRSARLQSSSLLVHYSPLENSNQDRRGYRVARSLQLARKQQSGSACTAPDRRGCRVARSLQLARKQQSGSACTAPDRRGCRVARSLQLARKQQPGSAAVTG